MKIIEILREIDRALLIGIGGGGDVVSTLIVSNFFELFDVECIHGGVVWERVTRDPKPGPRSIEEIKNCDKINDRLAWVNEESRIDGLKPIVAQVAEFLGKDVVAVDITKGELGVRRSLKEFVKREGIDLVVGVDAGGDSLARGKERNLCSPLADSIMLSALGELRSILAITGFGSDGELSREELETYLSEIAERGGMLGVSLLMKDMAEKLFEFVKEVHTEASRIPVMAGMGFRGKRNVWGRYEVEVSILNALTFYIDIKTLLELTPLPKAVKDSESVFEANERLHELGLRTELDFEIEWSERPTDGKIP